MSGRERTANHRANRGADHDIGNDAVGAQRPQDADMSEAARRPAAEGDADHWPPDTTQADFIAYFLAHLLAVIRLALAASDQYFEHITLPAPSIQTVTLKALNESLTHNLVNRLCP